MSTISTTTRSRANMNTLIVLAIAFLTVLAFAVAPIVDSRKASSIPVTTGEDAYLEYLRGEKMVYASPSQLSDALSAHHLGEKPAADLESALSAYRAGEKVLYAVHDLESALVAYHMGEKAIVPFEVRESALMQHRLGEKDIE